MLKQYDDNSLVKMATSGDRNAFEKLVSSHYQTIYKIAFQWCGNQSDAQDITQNVCIKLARALHSYQGEATFTSWLYALVVNTAKDWQRRQTAVTQKHIYDGDADIAVNTKVDQILYLQQVMKQVFQLPAGEKEALLLVVNAGMSHLEAAAVVGCKESTISWRIHEARKKLNPLFKGGTE